MGKSGSDKSNRNNNVEKNEDDVREAEVSANHKISSDTTNPSSDGGKKKNPPRKQSLDKGSPKPAASVSTPAMPRSSSASTLYKPEQPSAPPLTMEEPSAPPMEAMDAENPAPPAPGFLPLDEVAAKNSKRNPKRDSLEDLFTGLDAQRADVRESIQKLDDGDKAVIEELQGVAHSDSPTPSPVSFDELDAAIAGLENLTPPDTPPSRSTSKSTRASSPKSADGTGTLVPSTPAAAAKPAQSNPSYRLSMPEAPPRQKTDAEIGAEWDRVLSPTSRKRTNPNSKSTNSDPNATLIGTPRDPNATLIGGQTADSHATLRGDLPASALTVKMRERQAQAAAQTSSTNQPQSKPTLAPPRPLSTASSGLKPSLPRSDSQTTLFRGIEQTREQSKPFVEFGAGITLDKCIANYEEKCGVKVAVKKGNFANINQENRKSVANQREDVQTREDELTFEVPSGRLGMDDQKPKAYADVKKGKGGIEEVERIRVPANQGDVSKNLALLEGVRMALTSEIAQGRTPPQVNIQLPNKWPKRDEVIARMLAYAQSVDSNARVSVNHKQVDERNFTPEQDHVFKGTTFGLTVEKDVHEARLKHK